MPTSTALRHIELDEQGRPWVTGTNVKVIEIVLDHLAFGWSAEAIQEQHSGLSLAQIYAALAWYYDHQAEMDAEIAEQDERIQKLQSKVTPSSLQRRLDAAHRGR